jgi:Protein of unknown function (DUF2569)
LASPVVFHTTSHPQGGGIGGWLLLMAVGVCLAPIRIAAELIRGLRPLEPATWHAVTTPGTRAYHPLFGPLIVGELVTNAALLIWAGVLVYLFFTRRRSFPVAMIAFMLTRVVVQIADAGVALMIPAAAARMGPATYGGLASGVLVALIWVPYLLKSRRVELTFVR